MSEKYSRSSEMSLSESAFVEKARHWTERLCTEEERGHADFVSAMSRVAWRLRLPYGFLKELLYRPPKTISAGRFFTLAVAHDERLGRRDSRTEERAFDPATALGRTLIRMADALDRAADAADRAGGVK